MRLIPLLLLTGCTQSVDCLNLNSYDYQAGQLRRTCSGEVIEMENPNREWDERCHHVIGSPDCVK